jgi:hypothetical protein
MGLIEMFPPPIAGYFQKEEGELSKVHLPFLVKRNDSIMLFAYSRSKWIRVARIPH